MGFDIGQSIGNGLWADFYLNNNKHRSPLVSTYFGREYNNVDIESCINNYTRDLNCCVIKYQPDKVAKLLAQGKTIGIHWGRSEMGPRALGNRSILASPQSIELRRRVSEEIKSRESFQPLAPVVMTEYAHQYFDLPCVSPFMTITGKVKSKWRKELEGITHIDSTSRVQTVDSTTNSQLYSLLEHFMKRTGFPILINTSLNLKEQPISETPADAIKLFFDSSLDVLVVGGFCLLKK